MSESVQSAWLSCAALDVISLHAYGVGDFATSNLQTYVNQAKNAGKKMLMEEWGACYYSTENNNCPSGSVLGTSTRNSNIKTWAAQINAAGLSWLYWQVLPNNDPHVSVPGRLGRVVLTVECVVHRRDTTTRSGLASRRGAPSRPLPRLRTRPPGIRLLSLLAVTVFSRHLLVFAYMYESAMNV